MNQMQRTIKSAVLGTNYLSVVTGVYVGLMLDEVRFEEQSIFISLATYGALAAIVASSHFMARAQLMRIDNITNPQNQLNFGKEDGPSRASFGGPG